MTIKIGDKTYPTSRPSDLDEQLVASTGCNAAELLVQMGGFPLAGTVAAAIRPFLAKDAPSVPALAGEIAVAGVDDVRAQVIALYASAPAVKAVADAK